MAEGIVLIGVLGVLDKVRCEDFCLVRGLVCRIIHTGSLVECHRGRSWLGTVWTPLIFTSRALKSIIVSRPKLLGNF